MLFKSPEQEVSESKARPVFRAIRNFIVSLPPFVLGGVTLMFAFGGTRHHVLAQRAGQIPIAFSELGQNVRDFARNGLQVPILTRTFSVINDSVMKILESSNIAFQFGNSNEAFARELEERIDPAMKIHAQLPPYAAEIPGDVDQSLQVMDKLVRSTQELPSVNGELDNSWSHSSYDVTHTETHTDCSTDSKGVQTCTTTTTEVCDYSVHNFDYDAAHGNAAASLLNAFMARHPDLHIDERLHPASATHADNEYAIERSMRRLLKGHMPSPAEFLSFANTWKTGSTFDARTPRIETAHGALKRLAPVWDSARFQAQSERVTTSCGASPAGPRGYQIVEAALANGQEIDTSSRRIIDGLTMAKSGIPQVERLTREFIAVALDGKKGDPDKTRDTLMTLSKEIYKANFENGLDVETMKWWDWFLFGLAGLALGAAIDGGARAYMENKTGEDYNFDNFMRNFRRGYY
ncbi:MAG TPA: hypothetical protein VL625_05525 [Patescibacteria group bacterium]|nr:hypothetical protein [Patescibacteria group bacterium]